MEIKYENIILRDIVKSDIEDYVRWFTNDTEWAKWDAPWESAETDELKERETWTDYYESCKNLTDEFIRKRFEIVHCGKHIGWVTSYLIDENYKWISAGNVKEWQTVYRAIGIDICEKNIWGNGIGTNALRAFIQYNIEHGYNELYTQTWSGNTRMLRTVEKLGFKLCNRVADAREVSNEKYDALTFVFKD